MKFTVDILKVTEHDGRQDFDEVVNGLCQNNDLTDRKIEINGTEYQTNIESSGDNILFGWIRKIVKEHPKKGKVDSPGETDIELEAGEELVERAYFLYDAKRRLLFMQYKHYGPRKGTLQTYVNKLIEDTYPNDTNNHRRFSLVPIPIKDLNGKLNNPEVVFKTLQVVPYRNKEEIQNDRQISEMDNPIFEAERLFTDANTTYVFKDFARDLVSRCFRKNKNNTQIAFSEFSDLYENVIITIKNVDGKEEKINFSNFFAREIIENVGSKEKTITSEEAIEALKKIMEKYEK